MARNSVSKDVYAEYRVVLAGDAEVGKTSLLYRFAEDKFEDGATKPTITIDNIYKTIDVEGKKIRLNIWDTAGQERFKTLTQAYYKHAQAVLIVFDMTEEGSFKHVLEWKREVSRYSPRCIKVLVGNKSDLADPKISAEEAKDHVSHFELDKFFETSAKSGENVKDVFAFIAKECLHKIGVGKKSDTIDPSTGKNYKKGGCPC